MLEESSSVLYFVVRGPIHPKLAQNEHPRWRTPVSERTRVRSLVMTFLFSLFSFSFTLHTLPLATRLTFGAFFHGPRSNTPKTSPKRTSKMADTGKREDPSSIPGDDIPFFSFFFFFHPPHLASGYKINLRCFLSWSEVQYTQN